MGLGDEQHDFGYEGELDPWLLLLQQLLPLHAPYLLSHSSSNSSKGDEDIWLPPPLYRVEVLPSTESAESAAPPPAPAPALGTSAAEAEAAASDILPLLQRVRLLQANRNHPHKQQQVIYAQLLSSRRITATDHFQVVQHLKVRGMQQLQHA